MFFKKRRRESAIRKELLLLQEQEERLAAAAMEKGGKGWKAALESKLPPKVYDGLQSAFCKAFGLVFKQGRFLIEKSYRKEDLQEDQRLRQEAFRKTGKRRELKRLRKSARQSDTMNLTVTTVEGLGLGVLGVGLPDIVLFLSTLLRGIYKTALGYGFDYSQRSEQLQILKMMAASLSTGQDWQRLNEEVERGPLPPEQISEEMFQAQLLETSSAFALDMLLLKFIQGLPVVGLIGGAANPVYYRKVMRYIQLKYHKRYLLQLQSSKEK